MTTQYRPDIRCGRCESPDTAVTTTKPTHYSITRHRKCRACGHTFKTIEVNAMHLPVDAKLDFPFRLRKSA